jgi:hypothetical protein
VRCPGSDDMRRATLNRDAPVRRLIVPLTLAVATVCAAQAFAQATFPAPLPGQAEAPASNASPVPHVSSAVPLASQGVSAVFLSGSRADACMKEFMPLREEAEERSRLIKAASDRNAPPDEACKLIASFSRSEIRMIKYVEANSAKCGISPEIADQLRNGHGNTEKVQRQVCAIAQQRLGSNEMPGPRRRAPVGPVGDFWPASAPLLRAINPL